MRFLWLILDERSSRRMERRVFLNVVLIFFGSIIFLSVWHKIISNPVKHVHNKVVPVYVLNTINFTYTYPIHDLAATDYSSLINLTNFRFNFLSNCTEPLLLLVLIHSSPENYSRRKSIRDTWGSYSKNIKVLFVLGQVSHDYFQKLLEEEQQVFNDFIQGSFLDDYKNMSYKHVMSLKYAIYHCPKAKYILKTDDDIFVNIPQMLNILNVQFSPYGAQKLLLCIPLADSPVKRSYRFKWRVSYHEIAEKYYPTYCPGWALVYSPDVLFNLYKAAQQSKYFWIDDVFITGFLAKQENIQHTDMKTLVLEWNSFINHDYGAFVFAPPNLKLVEMYELWNFLNNCTAGNCRH